MAPREIRSANLLYICTMASVPYLLIVGGHLLGVYELTAPALPDVPLLAFICLTIVGLLAGVITSPEERRRAAWLRATSWAAMIGSFLLTGAFDHPGWRTYLVLTAWTSYLVVVSPLALRWFLGARRAAWSQVAALP
jgi:hypothetical protein